MLLPNNQWRLTPPIRLSVNGANPAFKWIIEAVILLADLTSFTLATKS
jgi:hypothetical protein